jgi:hypothetical protein
VPNVGISYRSSLQHKEIRGIEITKRRILPKQRMERFLSIEDSNSLERVYSHVLQRPRKNCDVTGAKVSPKERPFYCFPVLLLEDFFLTLNPSWRLRVVGHYVFGSCYKLVLTICLILES